MYKSGAIKTLSVMEGVFSFVLIGPNNTYITEALQISQLDDKCYTKMSKKP